jgi:DNA-binding transcriptional LysR family regulator
MELTLTQLRFFREVARREGFTAAAEALHVSQPAVSRCIQLLERQVGVRLFERAGRRVRLTAAGGLLLPCAERVLQELDDAAAALADLAAGEGGRLLLGASSTPGTYLLPQVLGMLRRSHPRVELQLEIADTHQVLAALLEGRLDLAVVGEAPFAPRLQTELLLTEQLVLVLPPTHPLANRARVTPGELAAEPFVLREPGSSTRAALERALAVHGVRPRVAMELGSMEAVKKSVAAGLGLSMVSEHAVALEVRAGVLAARRVEGLNVERGLYAAWRSSHRRTALQARFMAALRAMVAGGATPSAERGTDTLPPGETGAATPVRRRG